MADSSDLMMKLVLDGQAIAGACKTNMAAASRVPNLLVKGFAPKFMMEVDSFSFKCGTSGDEPGAPPTPSPLPVKHTGLGKPLPAAETQKRASYAGFRAGKQVKYPLDVSPISFTRPIDATSGLLIQNCIDCISYDSATIIKRKAIGSELAGEVYLRMDFIGVLIIKVDWSDDDLVKETCTFITRSIILSYRPQMQDGSLGALVSGYWSMNPNDTQPALA